MKKILFIIGLAVAAMACNNAGKQKTTVQTATEESIEVTAPDAGLFDNEWQLTALNGEAIVLDTIFNKAPSLIFDKKNSRFSGKGGCNGFGGNFKLKESGKIELSDISTTQMACPNLDLEGQFFEALRNAKSYIINNNTLILKDEAGTSTTKFKAVKIER